MLNAEERFRLRAISLTSEERDRYYLGFSNQTLWPLFHGFPSRMEFSPLDWQEYRSVNWKFASLLDQARNGDALWVHDYHLILLGQALRYKGYHHRIGFFLHTPFPDPETFFQLPNSRQILRGLLHYDALGFQTERDRRNFNDAVEAASESESLRRDEEPFDLDPVTGSNPISIDFDEWSVGASGAGVTTKMAEIRESLGDVSTLLLGVDRLDYSKGIPAKIRGLREALRQYPELRGDVLLLQLLVPSRQSIPAYQQVKALVDRLAGEVNEEFGNGDWKPIRIIHGEWDRDELMAHYRAADVALVTSLRDGMNLVSKEFCACRVQEPGRLVLSRYAGSANQLSVGAFLVEPQDPGDLARGIHQAIMAPMEEARKRMGEMRKGILKEDVHWWADSFLQAIEEVGPGRVRAPRQLYPGMSARTGRHLVP